MRSRDNEKGGMSSSGIEEGQVDWSTELERYQRRKEEEEARGLFWGEGGGQQAGRIAERRVVEEEID